MKVVLVAVLSVVILLLAYDFWRGYRVSVCANLYGHNLYAHVFFLYPWFDIFVRLQDGVPVLHIAVLQRDLLQISLKKKGHAHKGFSAMRMARSVELCKISVETRVGFSDPFFAAMAFAAAGVAAGMLPVEKFSLEPVFFSDTEQLRLDAHARVKVGKTILNYLKNKP